MEWLDLVVLLQDDLGVLKKLLEQEGMNSVAENLNGRVSCAPSNN